jgi:hypothetical protein
MVTFTVPEGIREVLRGAQKDWPPLSVCAWVWKLPTQARKIGADI